MEERAVQRARGEDILAGARPALPPGGMFDLPHGGISSNRPLGCLFLALAEGRLHRAFFTCRLLSAPTWGGQHHLPRERRPLLEGSLRLRVSQFVSK